jgi:wyosine [tRNA(Phe)-imidazoG37] synthetase (radical SAM superfamily)
MKLKLRKYNVCLFGGDEIAVNRRFLALFFKRYIIQAGLVTPKVTSLNVFATHYCNFSCFYCSRNIEDGVPGVENRYEDKSEFHIDELRLLLAKYPSIKRVSFVGVGEPFLIRDLIPMARLSKNLGKYVIVITNGSLLHHYWGKIGPLFDQISISLHGLSAIELKNIAKVNEQVFNRFVENVRYLVHEERRLNPSLNVRASVVVLKRHLQRAQNAAKFCEKHSIRELDLQNYLPVSLDDFNNCIFDNDLDHIAFIERLIKEFTGVVKINPPVLIKREDKALLWGCTTFFNTLRVDGLGNVSGCPRIMIPMEKNGNFRDEPNVWQNAYFREMRRRFRGRQDMPECCRYCPDAQ